MAEKVYKTHRQLLAILRNRGMDIKKGSQGSRVMRILEKENYYNIVNGYKELFLKSPASATTNETYLPGTTFDEVYALYNFDKEIRTIYLKYLLKIESTIKTVIAHEFSSKYGHDNYLTTNSFQTAASTDVQELKRIAKKRHFNYATDLSDIKQASAEENAANVVKLIGDIHQEIARQMSNHHQVVTHYLTHHGYIPLWVLVNVLTFGKIAVFYNNMKQVDKTAVAKRFSVSVDELSKYMDMLCIARNKCAHDERFYNIEFRKRLHTKSIRNFAVLGIERQSDGSYTYGTNDAYAIAIIFATFLSKTELKDFVSAMSSAIMKLQKQLHTIPVSTVLREMGFGTTWTKLTELKK